MIRRLSLLSVFAVTLAAACSQAPSDPPTTEIPATSEASEVVAMERTRTDELQLIAERGLMPYGPNSDRTADTIDILLPAPWDRVADTDGTPISIKQIMGPQGAVIVFNRSAEWCPYCQKQMIELEAAKDRLAAEGMTLTVLTYDRPEVLKAFAEKHDLTYTFVSDTDSSTIKAWGLLNNTLPEGTRYYGVPHPGFAVLSPDGDIKGLLVEEDYKIRPSIDDIVREAVGFRDAG